MVTCPRCGNDAAYLVDESFSLVRCDFCGDDIDASEIWHAGNDERTVQSLPSRPADQPRVPADAQVA